MATAPEGEVVQNRGLLTEDDRQFWRGEKDVDDPDKTAREKRHNVRKRISRIVTDLQILSEAGETDLVNEFHAETDRGATVDDRVERLEEQLESLQEEMSENDDE